jgi:hypothetical protein
MKTGSIKGSCQLPLSEALHGAMEFDNWYSEGPVSAVSSFWPFSESRFCREIPSHGEDNHAPLYQAPQDTTAKHHCKTSLQNITAKHHCKTSLQNITAKHHCKTSLHRSAIE